MLYFTFSHSGIKGADEDELREMASTPHSKHVYNVPNFDMIQEVQKKIITEVCSGVDEQLSSLVSGDESKSWHRMVLIRSSVIGNLQPSKHFNTEYILKAHVIINYLQLFPSGGAGLKPAGHRNRI